LAFELFLAWHWGPSRTAGAGTATGSARAAERKWYLRILTTAVALVPLAATVFVLATLVHYERTGNLLGFLPDDPRHRIAGARGARAAQPGEGTRWRLEGFTAFVRNAVTDQRIVLALAVVCATLTFVLYRLERRAVPSLARLVVPGLLRVGVFLLALFVLLPQ